MYIYTVYKTTNLLNDRYYIGKHKTTNPNDNYLGSGTIIKNAIAQYGKENFKKEILATFDNEDDAFAKEQELVNESLVNDPNSYNLLTGGLGGRTHHEESKQKMSKSKKGKTPWNKGIEMWSEEDRKRIGEQNKARGPQSEETIAKRIAKTTGKKRTPEQIATMTAAMRKKVIDHPFTEETKKKMSEAKKGRSWEEVYGVEGARKRREAHILRLRNRSA